MPESRPFFGAFQYWLQVKFPGIILTDYQLRAVRALFDVLAREIKQEGAVEGSLAFACGMLTKFVEAQEFEECLAAAIKARNEKKETV